MNRTMCGTHSDFQAQNAASPTSTSPSEAPFDISSAPTLPPRGVATAAEGEEVPFSEEALHNEARMLSALGAGDQAEASLGGLVRAIQQLSEGVGGAHEVNELLTQELEALRDTLAAASNERFAFRHQIQTLEQALDRARLETRREREFLIAQHDAFIVQLLDEQQAELERRDREQDSLRERFSNAARRSVAETVPPPTLDNRTSARLPLAELASQPEEVARARAERAELEQLAEKLAEDRERARETVQRLQAQRDAAQSAVSRITHERDDALHEIHRLKSELGGPRIPLSSRPSTVEPRRLDSISTKPPGAPISERAAPSPTLETGPEVRKRSAELGPMPAGPPRFPSLRSTPPAAAGVSNNPAVLAIPMLPIPAIPPTPSAPVTLPLAPSSRPPLKQKPDVSTRPLVGYSLSSQSIEAERLEGVRLAKSPERDKR